MALSACSGDRKLSDVYGSWYSEEQTAFNLRLQRLHIEPDVMRIYDDSFRIVDSTRNGNDFTLSFADGHKRQFRIEGDKIALIVPYVGEISYHRVEPLSSHKGLSGGQRLMNMGQHFKEKGG